MKLRRVPFNHSATSFTRPVVPLAISIPWSRGRMKVRHPPATVEALACRLSTAQVSRALANWEGVHRARSLLRLMANRLAG